MRAERPENAEWEMVENWPKEREASSNGGNTLNSSLAVSTRA